MKFASYTLKVGFLLAAMTTGPAAMADILRIGSVSDEPTSEITKFLPLAKYLEELLEPRGIDGVKIVVASGMPEMATMMAEGQVDIYMDSPFPAIVVSRLSGSQFLLRRWKKGVGDYESNIFARKDSGVTRLEDLQGKVIAFEEPFSSSGFMLPMFSIKKAGFKLIRKEKPTDRVAADEIGYAFSNEDENTVIWVLEKRVAAGAIDDTKLEPLAHRRFDQLHVLHSTMRVPRQVVLGRPNLPDDMVRMLKQALVSMVETSAGRGALRDFERTIKFDEIPKSFWDTLPELSEFVDEIVEIDDSSE